MSRSFKLGKGLRTIAVSSCVIALTGTAVCFYFCLRSDPSKVSTEQLAVFQTYLYSRPVLEKPLPVVCDLPRKWNVDRWSVDIWSSPHTALLLKDEMKRASWIQRRVFETFTVRNLRSHPLDRASLIPPNQAGGAEYAPIPGSEEPAARLSQVGFSKDFSEAMLFAEVRCGEITRSEFAYFARDVKHGNRWYVVRSDPS
jgi:hypothetical protein